ncbi:MAG: S41 family peptidase, partial [Hyphomicrobiaceae bacterium]
MIYRNHLCKSHRSLRWRLGRLPIGLTVGLGIALAAVLATPHPTAAQETSASRSLEQARPSRQLLAELFDAVVKTTVEQFVDERRLRAVEWEKLAAERRPAVVDAGSFAQAAVLINDLLGALQISHTAVFTPDQIEYYILLDVFASQPRLKDLIAARFGGSPIAYEGIGAFTTEIAGRHFIDGVFAGSRAAVAGLQFGDEIVEADGEPFQAIASFRGKADRDVRLAVRRDKDGPVENVALKVERLRPLQSFRQAHTAGVTVHTVKGKRIGYVPVWASAGKELQDAFAETIQKAFNPPVDGLIVDMRGKVGGTIDTVRGYLQALAPRGPLVGFRGRRGHTSAPATYKGRSALLIDHHTRSAAEIFAHAFQREFIGPLVGTRTARAVSASRLFAMPGGLLLHLAAYD